MSASRSQRQNSACISSQRAPTHARRRRLRRFDTVVCWKSDRLSRGMYAAAAFMEVVEAHGIGLEAVMDAIDIKTFELMAAIGKIELDNFRERASMGKRGAAKQGRIPVNHVPDGYRIGEARTPRSTRSARRSSAASSATTSTTAWARRPSPRRLPTTAFPPRGRAQSDLSRDQTWTA